MKGIVFTSFNEMIEEEMGMTVWERILKEVNPESLGVYTAVEDYDDQELFDLVHALSEITDIPVNDLVKYYGNYLFTVLIKKYPIFVENIDDYFQFLESIDNVIHKEVEKLYVSPNLPKLTCKKIDDKTLHMKYESPRKLCQLAEGLIKGAADYYSEEYLLAHNKCMHDGNDYCEFIISR